MTKKIETSLGYMRSIADASKALATILQQALNEREMMESDMLEKITELQQDIKGSLFSVETVITIFNEFEEKREQIIKSYESQSASAPVSPPEEEN